MRDGQDGDTTYPPMGRCVGVRTDVNWIWMVCHGGRRPGAARTRGLKVRNLALYPLSYLNLFKYNFHTKGNCHTGNVAIA